MAKNIELDENIIKKNKIPILIEDSQWRSLFKSDMTRSMEKTSKVLKEKVIEYREATKQIKIYKKLKKDLMQRVLQFSDEVNNNKNENALDSLEQTKEKILQANDKIDEFQFMLETLPKEIEILNKALLTETISIAYEKIDKGSSKIEDLTDEIIKLRDQLKSSWDEKIELEKTVDDLYHYLHNTLGYEETNKLDKKFL
ncbi:hypothetical protein [Inediibacterium massiliense]|uniref:hypothetical protein n=1 Tax=Inediibacterium massiliense TaxID=1658111 RepID=UPI0006B4071C|nr:hypothetical protein [Inediibacterium massiliense]